MHHPLDPAAVAALVAVSVVLTLALQPRRRLVGALVRLAGVARRRHRRTLHAHR